MLRILLAVLIFQAAVLAQAPAVETVRGKLRPSLVVISKRVLGYAAEGDYARANKAAQYLDPLVVELEKRWKDRFVVRQLLRESLKNQDLSGVHDSLRNLVLADFHDLLSNLTKQQGEEGPSPRTRLLMAQQDLKFLQAGLPKDKQGQRLRLALDKLFHALIQTVPHKAEYGKAEATWMEKADSLGQKILTLIHETEAKPESAGVSP